MEKNKGYTIEDGIIYIQDPASGHYTVYYANKPHILTEGRTKEEAKADLIKFCDIIFKIDTMNEITDDLTSLK